MKKPLGWLVGFVVVVIFACFCFVNSILAINTTNNSTTWFANRDVFSVVNDGDKTYLGGYFNYVGPQTGRFAILNSSTKTVESAYVYTDSYIKDIVADGSGGWYVVGDFSIFMGQTRNGAAHILANGTLDSSWNPNLGGGSSRGNVIALSPDGNTVYIGGWFTTVNGGSYTRNYLAAFNTTTGAADANWNPNLGNIVYGLAVDNNKVYAGGTFTTVNGGITRNRLAAFEIANGTNTGLRDTNWNPNLSGGQVNSIAIDATKVYVGGFFTSVNGGTTRNRLAAFALADGVNTGTVDTNWNPNANAAVYRVISRGTNIYLGGEFTTLNGGSYSGSYLARVDKTNGTADNSFHANGVGYIGGVYGLAVSADESIIYAGGGFGEIGGSNERRIFAQLNGTDGSATTWELSAEDTDLVYAIDIYSTKVAAGGTTNSIGGKTRRGLARLNADGTADDWNPSVNNEVRDIEISDNVIYAAGRFTAVNNSSVTRNNLAGFDDVTAAATSFNPNVSGDVYGIDLNGSTLYVSGDFTSVNGGTTRNRAAGFDISTGTATSFNPNLNSWGEDIEFYNNHVYIGGWYTLVNGGTAQNGFGRFDPTTGILDATWNPTLNDGIYDFEIDSLNNRVFAGGYFSTAKGGVTRNYAAAFSLTDATPTTWNPNLDDVPIAIEYTGSNVIIGGWFGSVNGGTTRNYLAEVDNNTGLVTSWNPNAGDVVYSLDYNAGGDTLFVGGDYYLADNWGSDNDTPWYFVQFGGAPVGATPTPTSTPTPTPTPDNPGATPTPTPNLTSTPTPTPTATGSVAGASTSEPNNNSNSCSLTAPLTAPVLYELIPSSTAVDIYLVPVGGSVDRYTIFYTWVETEQNYSFTTLVPQGGGAVKLTVSELQPGNTYTFQAQAFNGCAAGPHGNLLTTTTLNNSMIISPTPVDITITPFQNNTTSDNQPTSTPTQLSPPNSENNNDQNSDPPSQTQLFNLTVVFSEILANSQELFLISGTLLLSSILVTRLSFTATLFTSPVASLSGIFLGTIPSASITSLLIANLKALPLIIIDFILLPLGIYRKRQKTIGIVFDSVNFKPIAHAHLMFYSKSGNLYTTYSNRDGRYFIRANTDQYTIKATKIGYSFPSVISTQSNNNLFDYIYQPDKPVALTQVPTFDIAIPMDSIVIKLTKFFWLLNWLTVHFYRLIQKIVMPLFFIFFIISIVVLIAEPSWWAIAASFFALMFLIYDLVVIFHKQSSYGIVFKNGKRASLTALILYQKKDNSKNYYTSTDTDELGRYIFTPENGIYDLYISAKRGEQLVAHDLRVTDDHPFVNLSFALEKLSID